MSDLQAFRHNKDEFFVHSDESPLSAEQKRDFRGLQYFPETAQLRFEVKVERIPGEQEIQIQTSTGGFQAYKRFGKLRFEVDGEAAELTVFSNHHGYFLPFVDSLAGVETYPAGRYLEPEPLGNGKFVLDFNLAYNPNCAYNEMWTCPLTPPENRLKAPIRAGEKLFHS